MTRDTSDVFFEALTHDCSARYSWLKSPWEPDPAARLIWRLDHGLNPNYASTKHNEHPRKEYGTARK